MVNKELLRLFKAWDLSGDSIFYLDGIAGCGKSTQVAISLLPFILSKYPDTEVSVIAPTHAAKDELHDKMIYVDAGAFNTMHAFVGMAPETVEGAVDLNSLTRNRRVREAMQADFLIVDEAGMADEECAGIVLALIKAGIIKRAIFLGDEHQLLPIKGKQLLTPAKGERWHYVIKTNYRAQGIPDVQKHVYDLYSRMEKGGAAFRFAPKASNNLHLDAPKELDPRFDRALAFTRRGVQNYNEVMTGRDYAALLDIVFSPTTKQHYRVKAYRDAAMADMMKIHRARGDVLNDSSDKWHERKFISNLVGVVEGLTLLSLQPVEVREGEWRDIPDTDPANYFVVYGTHRHQQQLSSSREAAIEANQAIVDADPKHFNGLDAEATHKEIVAISREHWDNPLVKRRKAAWRRMYAWEGSVLCIDAPYCTTVHAAQGATHRNTVVLHNDLKIAMQRGGDTYTRLLYVAMSRATEGVYLI